MLKPARNVKLISAVAMAMGVSYSHAAGFGVAQVQSWLGEPLNLNVTVIGTESSPGWYACINARIESLDGSVVFVPKIDVRKSGQRQSIQLTTHQNINEPAMNVVLKLGCELSVSRSYQILLDPVAFLPNVDTVAQAELAPAATSIQVTRLDNKLDNKPSAATERSDGRRVKLRQPQAKKSRATADNTAVTGVQAAKKVKPALANRLRLTLLEEPVKDSAKQKALAPTPPKSMPGASATSAKPSVDLPEQTLSAGDLTNATQMAMIKSLQVEIDTLRNENNRIKLKGTSDLAALQSVRSEIFSWLTGLGVILIMCLAAIMWLATRFISLKKTQNQSWNDLPDETTYLPRRKINEQLDEDTRETIANALQRTRKANIELEVNPIPSGENDDTDQKKLEDLERLRQLYERHSVMSARDTAIEQILQATNGVEPEAANFEPVRNEVTHNKVEEISDVMELVGAWMALHKPTEVLKLLEPFNHVETPDSPLPWLCLLDVYNSMNDQEKYEAIGKRLVALFNVKVVPWETRSAIGRANLANFPHVVNKILALWDSDDVEPYLASLLINDRESARVGFDLSIYRDIERLHVLAKDPSRPRDIDKLRNYKACAILFAPPPGLDEEAEDENTSAESEAELLPKLPKHTKYFSDYHYGGHYDGFSGDGSLNSKVETASANKVDEIIFNEPAISIPLDKPAKVASRDKTAAFLMDEPGVVAEDAKLQEVAEETEAPALISPITVKLKLAIAYQDIGDSEGAILLLEEVIQEGSEEEAEQARLMLSLMGD